MSTGGGSLLGVSVLELRTDDRQLDAGLTIARRKVDATGLGMQASWDRRMTSMGSSMRSFASDSTGSLRALSSAGVDVSRNVDGMAIAERTYQTEMARGNIARRAASRETRTLAAETGLSSRAMRDLYEHMGPVGRTLGDLTTRSRLYREHGIDYLAAGTLGLEAAFVAMSARAAVKFVDLGETVQRQTGLSGKSLDSLMDVIRRTARDSPYQIQQVADAAVILRKEFHQSDAQIGHSSELMIAFAKATGQDVRPQMQQLSRIMHDYREPLGNVVGLTDKLVSVSQATQQPISSMTDALDRFGPRLQALGFNLTDSIRLLGVFQASGIPINQVGRGIAAALTNIGNASKNGGAKLEQYRIAVKTAQERVDALTNSLGAGGAKQAQLSGELQIAEQHLAEATRKYPPYSTQVETARLRVQRLKEELANAPDGQKKLNAELQIAQDRLSVAKGKYDALNQTLKIAKGAHGDVAATIHAEIAQIVNAHSKQDALNIATQDFGKNLGPSMARAFYNNKKALQEVDQALGKTGATQRLFNVDAKSLPGEIRRAQNNFQDLEIAVGTKLVPALSDGVDWLRRTIHGFDDFAKKHPDLLKIAGGILGIGSALTILSRHSPLGDILQRLLGGKHAGLGSFLSGKGAGGIYGVRGPTAPGSVANPIATVGDSPPGPHPPVSPFPKDASEGEAAAKRALSDLRALTPRIAGGAVAGILAMSSASHAAPGALNELNAAAHGLDPTSVLHLVGLPAVSDLLPTVRKPMNAARATPLITPGRYVPKPGGGYRFVPPTYGVTAPHDAAGRTVPTQIGAGNAPFIRPTANVRQAAADWLKMNNELLKLVNKRQSVSQTAAALDDLAAKAAKAGDVRFEMADRVGAEMLRTRSVTSRGVRRIVGELKKLPPAASASGAQAMILMSQSLETDGKLPKGSTAKLIQEIEGQLGALAKWVQHWAAADIIPGINRAIAGVNTLLGLGNRGKIRPGVHRRTGGYVVPGDPHRDGTLIWASGEEVVLTGDGQRMINQERPGLLGRVVRHQAPHFQHGGPVASTASAGLRVSHSDAGDRQVINRALGQIIRLVGTDASGGDAAKKQKLIDYFENRWQSTLYPTPNFSSVQSPGDFILPDGTVSPHLRQVAAQLARVVGWDTTIVSDEKRALALARALGPAIRRAIRRRQGEIANLRHQPPSRARSIALDRLRNELGSGGAASPLAQFTGGGDSASGLFQALDAVRTLASTLGATGGQLAQARDQQAQDRLALKNLTPAGAAALATAAGGGSSIDSELVPLLQERLQAMGAENLILTADLSVFSPTSLASLPPFGGLFVNGGIVDAPPGAARTVITHGPEEISPPGSNRPIIQVVVQDGAVREDRIKVIARDTADGLARDGRVRRRLPSHGGRRV